MDALEQVRKTPRESNAERDRKGRNKKTYVGEISTFLFRTVKEIQTSKAGERNKSKFLEIYRSVFCDFLGLPEPRGGRTRILREN